MSPVMFPAFHHEKVGQLKRSLLEHLILAPLKHLREEKLVLVPFLDSFKALATAAGSSKAKATALPPLASRRVQHT